MSTPNFPSTTPPAHEQFLALIEKDLRGEMTGHERAELERHLAECQTCRAYAAQTQEENRTMSRAIEEVQAACDFERIKRAIANRKFLERVQDRITMFMIAFGALGAAAAYLFGAQPGFMSGFSALAIVSVIFWIYRRQLQKRWRDLAERCKAGEPLAFETFHRSARSYLALQQAGLLATLIMIPALGAWGISALLAGRWLYGGWLTLTAIALLPFVPIMWRSVFSRQGRQHEEALMTGQLKETRFDYHTSEKKSS